MFKVTETTAREHNKFSFIISEFYNNANETAKENDNNRNTTVDNIFSHFYIHRNWFQKTLFTQSDFCAKFVFI